MYHLGGWSEEAYIRMRRLDHSMIFVLIAGTYTPMCLVALHGTASWLVLAVVWTGAAIGIVTKMYRVDLHVLSGIMYIGLGWIAVFILPALSRAMSDIGMALVVSGGVIYTLGAIVLATHRPDPWPECVRLPRGVARLHDRSRRPRSISRSCCCTCPPDAVDHSRAVSVSIVR